MNLVYFNKAHTQSQKLKLLNGLDKAEKEKIILEQRNAILSSWEKCDVETSNLLEQNFDSLEDKIMEYDRLLSFADWTYKKYIYGQKTQRNIYQWDIFYCDLGHNIGGEKNKTRPVIILQKTKGYLDAKTIMVAPITIGDSFGTKKLFKHEILINDTYKGKIKGKIDLSHIRAVDKSRLDEKPKDRLLKLDEYKKRYPNGEFVTTQEKIKMALKQLFAIDI